MTDDRLTPGTETVDRNQFRENCDNVVIVCTVARFSEWPNVKWIL